MTYEELLAEIQATIRDTSSWPLSSSKLAEQLRIMYISVLVVYYALPFHEKETAVSTSSNLDATGIATVTLPSDLFRFAKEASISEITLDGHYTSITEQQPLYVLHQLNGHPLHSGSRFISFDQAFKTMSVLHTTEVSFTYAKQPTQPTTATYTTVEVPFGRPYIDQVIELVASRIAGIEMDTYQAQFHQLWQAVYNTLPTPPPSEPQEPTRT